MRSRGCSNKSTAFISIFECVSSNDNDAGNAVRCPNRNIYLKQRNMWPKNKEEVMGFKPLLRRVQFLKTAIMLILDKNKNKSFQYFC